MKDSLKICLKWLYRQQWFEVLKRKNNFLIKKESKLITFCKVSILIDTANSYRKELNSYEEVKEAEIEIK